MRYIPNLNVPKVYGWARQGSKNNEKTVFNESSAHKFFVSLGRLKIGKKVLLFADPAPRNRGLYVSRD